MKRSIIGHLILKDWRLNRFLISITVAAGIVALVLTEFGNETVRLVGGVWFFIVMCILGSMLPATAILNERKKQTLAFIMSLPVSSLQYTIAKMVSIWAMFLVPWLILLIAALALIATRSVVPHGVIPTLFILALLPLIGFTLISAATLIGETEGWMIGASVACNSSYWLAWYLIGQVRQLAAGWGSPVASWNQTVLMILSAEIACIVFTVAVTFLVQSRKRDFI
jgi:ABC-2 type transport system permease protein